MKNNNFSIYIFDYFSYFPIYVFSHFVSPKYKVHSPSRDEHIPRNYKATTERTFDKVAKRVFLSARSRTALRNILNPRMQFPRRISFSGRGTRRGICRISFPLWRRCTTLLYYRRLFKGIQSRR